MLFVCVEQFFTACLQDEKALFDAARRGDVPIVKRLLASNVNVNCTPYPEVQEHCVTFLSDGYKSYHSTERRDSADGSINQWSC